MPLQPNNRHPPSLCQNGTTASPPSLHPSSQTFLPTVPAPQQPNPPPTIPRLPAKTPTPKLFPKLQQPNPHPTIPRPRSQTQLQLSSHPKSLPTSPPSLPNGPVALPASPPSLLSGTLPASPPSPWPCSPTLLSHHPRSPAALAASPPSPWPCGPVLPSLLLQHLTSDLSHTSVFFPVPRLIHLFIVAEPLLQLKIFYPVKVHLPFSLELDGVSQGSDSLVQFLFLGLLSSIIKDPHPHQ
ncbi:uncharacterized protein LOC135226211 [Macrobrachium nipponense]|uniref:uncharacterized protein LOC135226211 n=1 Tax=Macrobrachium nipponense TaxID=159736 RepID=UPI0030C87B8B